MGYILFASIASVEEWSLFTLFKNLILVSFVTDHPVKLFSLLIKIQFSVY